MYGWKEMELRAENKAIFLIIGILFAWFALGIMFAQFFRADFNIEFDSAFILYGWLILWFICIAISSIFLGLGLKASKS